MENLAPRMEQDRGIATNPERRQLPERRKDYFWLATALNSAADGIIIVSANGIIQFVNAAAERMTGWLLREAKGKNYLDVLKLEHAGAPLKDDLIRLATLNEAPLSLTEDLMLHSRDGRWQQIEAEVAPAALAGGNPENAVFTFRDVTQRKWDERQLRQEHAIRAVERLAETTAHALNNLLTSILCHGELLLADTGLATAHHESVEAMQNSALEIAAVVRQLSAICRNKFTTRRELDLNEVIGNFLPAVSSLFSDTIKLKSEFEPKLQQINADPAQIYQILFALLSNARESIAYGGEVTISTRNSERDDSERLKPTRNFVNVTVADTGQGMTRETCDRALEPFFTTKKGGGHAGLGLCIAQGIISDYSGFLDIQSELGRGTQVTFGIPAIAEDAFTYLDQADKPISDVKTVLIVEDDHAVRQLLRKILQQRGYAAVEARDGEDALMIAELHEGSIDVLLTDIGMPGMSGPELVRRVAKLHPETKYLLISGFSPHRMGPATDLPRGVNFLQKPFRRKELLECLETILSPSDSI